MLHRKPKKNDMIYTRGKLLGRVIRTKGNLCYLDTKDSEGENNIFIWKFDEKNYSELNKTATNKGDQDETTK